jgi:SAM-dependent methyltransferase
VSFKTNFENYMDDHFDEKKLHQVIGNLTEFYRLDDFKGKSFLDLGSGAGIYSLAAQKLHADKVTSIDLFTDLTKSCRDKYGKKENWEIDKGSILDKDFLNKLPKHDLVYCWGVVHHTGAMWNAIENISNLVNPGGRIYLGIYNESDNIGFYPDGRFGTSSLWRFVKKVYVSLPGFVQTLLEYLAILGISIIYLLTFKNPIKKLKSVEDRGMSWRTSLKDWLIGYPYEYSPPEDVVDFFVNKGYKLIKLRTNNGLLTNHYCFELS